MGAWKYCGNCEAPLTSPFHLTDKAAVIRGAASPEDAHELRCRECRFFGNYSQEECSEALAMWIDDLYSRTAAKEG